MTISSRGSLRNVPGSAITGALDNSVLGIRQNTSENLLPAIWPSDSDIDRRVVFSDSPESDSFVRSMESASRGRIRQVLFDNGHAGTI